MSEAEAVIKKAPPPPRAKIYDLGYKRYYGGRRAQATRWQVITRDLLRQAWKRFWRFKAWVGLSALITAVVGAILVFTKSDKMGSLKQSGALVKLVDELVYASVGYYTGVCWILTMAVGCGVICSDLRSGAFTFYFARPVRAVDYILGKLAALTALHAAIIMAPMVVIAGIRIGLSENRTEMVENLGFLPKALLLGGMAALTYASLSLAFSSFFTKRWLNIAAWCGWYLILSNIFIGVSQATHIPEIGAIEPVFALKATAADLYDFQVPGNVELPGAAAGIIGLTINILVGIGVSFLRVRNAGQIGGSS